MSETKGEKKKKRKKAVFTWTYNMNIHWLCLTAIVTIGSVTYSPTSCLAMPRKQLAINGNDEASSSEDQPRS